MFFLYFPLSFDKILELLDNFLDSRLVQGFSPGNKTGNKTRILVRIFSMDWGNHYKFLLVLRNQKKAMA